MSKIQTKQITLVSPNGLVEKTIDMDDSGVVKVNGVQVVTVESGSNANGTYIKYSDGTMFQYSNSEIVTSLLPANTPQELSLNFAIPFVGFVTAMVGCWPVSSWDGVYVTGYTSSISQAKIRITNGASAQLFGTRYSAVGRWK